ncbi:helix-turn-helix domain-containing protein [Pseudomonas mediterranea]|uniref:helix-turn-helix domain-containing protein n=1 Tax=Pseudomonas mediterranea TaxID=183795 RepID=UPI0006D8CB6D|nr:helix-turn-helix domain-containing protein [Pseudomonas mediterranea]
MHHPKGFPSKLVRLRADAGMTQRELAKASGLSVPQISRYEMGTSKPRMTALVKLAAALNRDVSELVDAEDQPEITEISLVSEDESSIPIALPKETYERLQQEANEYGVSLDVMLSAVIHWHHSLHTGNVLTLEEALEKAVAELEAWPG